MYFKSEKSIGLLLIYMLLPLGGLTILTVYTMIVNVNLRIFLSIPLCLIVMADIISIWMWFDTGYLITEEKLIIKCGLLKTSIDLKSIKDIRKVKSYDKQWALSFDRLEIISLSQYTLCISPKNKDEFLEALKIYSGGNI